MALKVEQDIYRTGIAKKEMKTVAIIPAYNEEKHIGEVVKEAFKYVDNVLVCDDGSTDMTVKYARLARAKVVSLKRHVGKGKNVRHGIRQAIKQYDPENIVLMDGDGQHLASDIPGLVSALNEADIAFGIRHYSTMPFIRRFGNRLLTFVFNFGNKAKLQDSMSGFMALKTSVVPKNLEESSWGFEIELLLKSIKAGRKIKCVPVSIPYYRKNKSVLKMGFILLVYILKWRKRCRV